MTTPRSARRTTTRGAISRVCKEKSGSSWLGTGTRQAYTGVSGIRDHNAMVEKHQTEKSSRLNQKSCWQR
ncbi:hypothetical protein E2C01_044015 [Portunus trituberculatus]|uniref:Uncharacterized protein n=1 Tax=Portunus trituberculatus TaxID=210409 RepID=A0A5B7FUG0_PORTR|nr:hypothetical protein [Portunus trituberculatus]